MSDIKQGCMCDKCKDCCWHNPGWFGSIEEIEGAAKIKNMDIEHFVKEYLIREWYYAEYVEIPAPRRNFSRSLEDNPYQKEYWDDEKQKNGKGFVRATWGHNLIENFACILLSDDGKCTIHENKPKECRETLACKEGMKNPSRQVIEDYWKEHQEWLSQFIEAQS